MSRARSAICTRCKVRVDAREAPPVFAETLRRVGWIGLASAEGYRHLHGTCPECAAMILGPYSRKGNRS